MTIAEHFRLTASATIWRQGSSLQCITALHRTPCFFASSTTVCRYFRMLSWSVLEDEASQNSASELTSNTWTTVSVPEQAAAREIASRTAAALYADPSVAASSLAKPGVGQILGVIPSPPSSDTICSDGFGPGLRSYDSPLVRIEIKEIQDPELIVEDPHAALVFGHDLVPMLLCGGKADYQKDCNGDQ
jgi:hypothetical protein